MLPSPSWKDLPLPSRKDFPLCLLSLDLLWSGLEASTSCLAVAPEAGVGLQSARSAVPALQDRGGSLSNAHCLSVAGPGSEGQWEEQGLERQTLGNCVGLQVLLCKTGLTDTGLEPGMLQMLDWECIEGQSHVPKPLSPFVFSLNCPIRS